MSCKMLVVLVLTLCMLSRVSLVKASDQCNSHGSIDSRALKGHTFRTFLAKGPYECENECEKELRCQSYNYFIIEKVCEFNNRTKEARPEHFVVDSDRFYMKRWTNRVPLGSIPELSAESCKEIKASEGGEAVSRSYWLDPTVSGETILVHCDMEAEVADYCKNHQCLNSATCVNNHLNYTCICGSGWTGKHCELNIVCNASLGMENGEIPDSAVVASTTHSAAYKPSDGRLHSTTAGWIALHNNADQWFQVYFGNWAKVSNISTQGRTDFNNWVKKYRVSYSYDGNFFMNYKEDGENAKVFDGNTDRTTVVTNALKKPIITRYIRINPVEWKTHISLRAEFYGCKSGFEIPKLECSSALGMESHQIPDLAITAATRLKENHGPERSRLNMATEGIYGGGWTSRFSTSAQFLQIDLSSVTKVTGIATQGNDENSWWVKTYTLAYSDEEGNFTAYKNSQVLEGNTDNIHAVGRFLDPPIIGRFVQIFPQSWHDAHISMRVELYGCSYGISIDRPPLCEDALGMQNGQIPDSNITASSSTSPTLQGPSYGRLHYLVYEQPGGWKAGTSDKNQWFQVYFGNWTKLSAVATQGRETENQWVKSYSLSFYNRDFYEAIKDEYGTKKIFTANSDRYTVVKNKLERPIITRYIRIHPETWKNVLGMRTEFYGCKKGFERPILECRSPLGMENGRILNSSITASSRFDRYSGTDRARLHTKQEGMYGGGWAAQYNDAFQFLQIDLGNVTKVTAIATQGKENILQWVETFTLAYGDEEGNFTEYKNGQVLEGNIDNIHVAGNTLDPPIIGRFVQIRIKSWNLHVALRVELYGCSDGLPTRAPSQCEKALGMQNSLIPDSAITASSSFHSSLVPPAGRLHFLMAAGGKHGSWAALAADVNQWFQVGFGNWTKITAVATQGRQDLDQWVETYSLSFSLLSYGVFYETFNGANGAKKIFSGNTDRYTVVKNKLDKPIIALYIRIHPETWQWHISMRAELYGCTKGFEHPMEPGCRFPLGMENGKIPNSAIVASSRWSEIRGTDQARLHMQSSGWAVQYNHQDQFLQVDLGNVTKVTGIATQGSGVKLEWVTTYTLEYSDEDGNFIEYNSIQDLKGNTDTVHAVGRVLDPPIIGRFVQIRPKTYHGHMTMRVELYGCWDGVPTTRPSQCEDALGMQSGLIPDSAITASSSFDSLHAPSLGRLHFLMAGSGKAGSWVASVAVVNQWFQVGFGNWTKITAVATQGRQDDDQWVTSYSLSFCVFCYGIFYGTVNYENGTKKIFGGNSDRYTMVKNKLDKPIIAQSIRIHPETWNGHISMRTEIFGCTKGFEVPTIHCIFPLGMENGTIPDSSMVASSRYDEARGPEDARLQAVEGWAAKDDDANQFLQIDLGNVTKVTRVASQGSNTRPQWVTTYTLAYSNEEGNFTAYNNGQILKGNSDNVNTVGHVLDPPIIGRFVQIRPKTWNDHVTMRVELYGCSDGFPTYPPPQCADALGMQNGQIPDSAVTASSSLNTIISNHPPSHGRLHLLIADGVLLGGWKPATDNVDQWLHVDFGNWTKIAAVATQGRQGADEWVTSYSLSFCSFCYGVFYETFTYENGTKKIFGGNSDRYTVVRNKLDKPIIAQSIRIHPETWNGGIAMRTEFYGCTKGFVIPTIGCIFPLGMENGTIPDSSIVASSRFDETHGPEKARLHRATEDWAAKYTDANQFLQIDLGNVTKVTRIATQGSYYSPQWVMTYTLAYSNEEGNFAGYNNGQVLEGNSDNIHTVGRVLDPPIIGRFLQIRPKTYSTRITMRVELYGCYDGFSTHPPPQCADSLGMQNGQIPDSAVTASSSLNPNFVPSLARLHLLMADVGPKCCWRPATDNVDQWLHVDFGNWTKITAVATQSRQDANEWVTSYSLSFCSFCYGIFYETVNGANGARKIFGGNSDLYTVVRNELDKPIIAQSIRIHPETWNGHIAMRTEFYGCTKGFDIPTIDCRFPLGMENGTIPDSSIVASSRLKEDRGPEKARQHGPTKGWTAKYTSDDQFLQIDLGNVTKVTGIATQGGDSVAHWMMTYMLAYSFEEGNFTAYNNGQVLEGNTDKVNTVGHVLDPPVIGRFVQIRAKTWRTYITMRVELYGCSDGFPAYPLPQCADALGMQNGQIPDSAVTASSSVNNNFAPSLGRLHLLMADAGQNGCWRADTDNVDQWLQIDFGNWTKITAVATQGRQDLHDWVTSYSLSFCVFSFGIFYETFNEQNGTKKIFSGNSDRYTVVKNKLDKPIIARSMRIHPETWSGHISMRTELYGCRKGFEPPEIGCRRPLGMENGSIPDSSITASSQLNANWGPERARLHMEREGVLKGGWQRKGTDGSPYLQIDLGNVKNVTGIATQGYSVSNWWVTSYKLDYSLDGSNFTQYGNGDGQVFQGNRDNNAVVGRTIDPPIIARFVRVRPKDWSVVLVLRLELYESVCNK